MKLYIKMQASFFADCCICHLPKWHLIPFNYQRMYSRYKIWSFLFCFHSKRRERDSEKTWGRVLLVVIFCDIGPWGQLEKNIALLPFWKQQKHHYKMGLQSWASHCKTSSCPFAVRKELSPSLWVFPDCWSLFPWPIWPYSVEVKAYWQAVSGGRVPSRCLG